MWIKEPTIVVFIYQHKLEFICIPGVPPAVKAYPATAREIGRTSSTVLFLFMSHAAPPAGVDCMSRSQLLAGPSPQRQSVLRIACVESK